MDTNDTRRFGSSTIAVQRHHHLPGSPPAGMQSANANSNLSDGNPIFPETGVPANKPEPAPSAPSSPRADLLYFTDIEPRRVEWLWQDRLAAGSLAVISGNPGSGKTWVALAIAAALSNGHSPGATAIPSAAGSQPSTTLCVSAHHLGSELIRPRFLSLGGDPARLVLLRGVTTTSAPAARSLNETILEDALQRSRARLLILDPLHSYLAADGRHRAHEDARVFDSLAHLAEKHRCCILLVRHLRHRGRNSAAVELSAAARTEFLVGSSPDASALSALVQTKSNLGPLAPSLGYRIDPAANVSSAFHWTGRSPLSAEDLQTEQPIGAGLPRRKVAAEWLRRQLGNGPMTQQAVERAATRDGESLITVRRAKGDLGIVSTKNTFNGAWYWELPQIHPFTEPFRTEPKGREQQ